MSASPFTPTNECDSPNICRTNRGCCGQYGTKKTCAATTPPAAPAATEAPSLTNAQIADLRAKHGVTSNGRGIREFEQVASFVRDVLALAASPPAATSACASLGDVPVIPTIGD